jgi:hypothetical protein
VTAATAGDLGVHPDAIVGENERWRRALSGQAEHVETLESMLHEVERLAAEQGRLAEIADGLVLSAVRSDQEGEAMEMAARARDHRIAAMRQRQRAAALRWALEQARPR